MMKKKDILKNSIDRNYFDKEIILENVLSKESSKVNSYEEKIVDIKEIDSYPERPETKHRFGAIARTRMRLATICALVLAILLAGSIGSYSLLNKYHINKVYDRLISFIDDTKRINSGKINFEITVDSHNQNTTTFWSESQEFNWNNCFVKTIIKSGNDSSGYDNESNTYKYFNGIIYEYSGNSWKETTDTGMYISFPEDIGMKRIFDEFIFFEKSDITSINIISNKDSSIYRVNLYREGEGDITDEFIEYTVNSDGIIVNISYESNYFSSSGNPYGKPKKMETRSGNINLSACDVEIENPLLDNEIGETNPPPDDEIGETNPPPDDGEEANQDLQKDNLDLDGDNLPDSLVISMKEEDDLFIRMSFIFGNGGKYSILSKSRSVRGTCRRIEMVDLLGNGNKNIILLMDDSTGGSMFIVNIKSSGYEEWETPVTHHEIDPYNSMGGIKYQLKTTEKYIFALSRINDDNTETLIDMIDYRNSQNSSIEEYDSKYPDRVEGGVDSIYKFELIENDVNGYDIRIYQTAYAIMHAGTFGSVATDIRYDENGKFKIVKTEFIYD